MELNWTTIIVALIGTGGVGAFGREIVAGLRKMARGVAAKESSRADDIVAARIRAEQRALAAEIIAERRYENELTMRRHVARQDVMLIAAGVEPLPEPELHDTLRPTGPATT